MLELQTIDTMLNLDVDVAAEVSVNKPELLLTTSKYRPKITAMNEI